MSRHSALRVFLLPVAVFLVLLGILHLRYPLPYVYRVLAYRDSDYGDFEIFPARGVAASRSASALPVEISRHVAEVLEKHPEISDLETFLEETETTAFLVVSDGRLIEERYLQGHDEESLQNTFSVSKSVMSALVGLAVEDGVLDLDDSITRYLPELAERDARFGEITVRHLLDMESGIRYESDVQFPFINSDDPLIYYSPDLESVVLERTEIESPPGEFEYNNYNPPLIGLILRRTTGMAPSEYLERKLWQPLGAQWSAGWTTDDHGFERMESGFHARARDLARLGQLFLNRGALAGRQILPDDWVAETTDFPEPVTLERYDGRSWGYLAGWWLVPRPDGPADFTAIGRYGQFIYVSPQYDVVFVRSGPGRGEWGDRDWTQLFYETAQRLSERFAETPAQGDESIS